MFTGLVEQLGSVEAIEERDDGDLRLRIRTADVIEDLELGESIAVDGCCLTAVEIEEGRLSVDVSTETCDRTTLGELVEGDGVHLERALRVGDRLGGHFVQGHVDGVGTVRSRRRDGDGWRVEFDVPERLTRYLIEKGSVAVDGVSLTVNERDRAGFSVMIVPHTAAVTKLGEVEPGDAVNLEVDMIGKYVEKLVDSED